jgi:hypothetical protein
MALFAFVAALDHLTVTRCYFTSDSDGKIVNALPNEPSKTGQDETNTKTR